jgi:dihydrofolate reductase
MKKIVIYLNISLDGVVSDVENWANINDDVLTEAMTRYEETDIAIFGGATYEGMAAYWQQAESSSSSELERIFAKMLNDKRKIIITNKELQLNWRNAEQWIINDPDELLEKLNTLEGIICVESGLRTWRKFIRHHLFDELHFIVQPVIAGSGEKLFEDGLEKVPLRLLSTEQLKGGLLKLEYKIAGQ